MKNLKFGDPMPWCCEQVQRWRRETPAKTHRRAVRADGRIVLPSDGSFHEKKSQSDWMKSSAPGYNRPFLSSHGHAISQPESPQSSA